MMNQIFDLKNLKRSRTRKVIDATRPPKTFIWPTEELLMFLNFAIYYFNPFEINSRWKISEESDLYV